MTVPSEVHRPETNSPQPKPSILLVDDKAANLLALRAILEDPVHDLVEAHSGEEALRLLQAGEYAVVLLDLWMPGLSGLETAKLIRANDRSRRTPIIILTANDVERPQMEEAYALGAVDFLVKPLVPVILRAKVRGFVELFEDKQRAKREAEQLRLLVESAKDYAIFILDPQGHIVSWNPGAERIKQYKAEEIIGQHFSKFYPQEPLDRGWPAYELKVAAAEGRFEDEGWRVRKDGSQFWANVIITALKNEQGKLLGFSKITRDLTARKQAEEHARRLAEETAARKVAEENARIIHEQRERLRVTLASIGDAVISTDAQGRVDFLNPVAEELVGWKAGEAAGKSLEDVFRIVNEETRQPVENPAMRALREGKIVGLANHTVLISKDGIECPIDDSAAPIRSDRGDIFGSVLVFRDISERKRNEQRLREQQEWLRVTLASIGDAVIATDVQGRVTLVNQVAAQLTGWSQEEAQGQPLEEIFAIANEETGQAVESPVAKVLREGTVVGLGNHTVLIARDGTQRPIDDSAAPIRDSAGEMLGVVLIFRDVGQQRKAERELRSSEARKAAVLNTALDAIITMDREGRAVELNPAAERMFGYRREALVGKQLADFVIPQSPRERDWHELTHYLATGQGPVLGRRLEMPALRADGTEFPVELSITRISQEGPPLFTAYLRDLTEAKRAERHRNARLAVTQVLSQAAGLREGVAGVLAAVCESLTWDVGFLWTPNGDESALSCLESWHNPQASAAKFEKACRSRTFASGEGLPGRVWATREPAWITDVASDDNFPRAATAAECGLRSGLASPVIVGDKTLGVIEFFARAHRQPDAELLELISSVAGNVGQFIERRRAVEELRASAERLSLALAAADLGDWSWDAASDVVTFSDRAAEVFGIPPGPHMTWTAMQGLLAPADRERARREVERVVAERVQYDIEYRVNRQDGSQVWVGVLGRAVYDADGQVVSMYGVVQDITSRKRLEESLLSSEERLRLALAAGHMGVWDWNIRTGDITWSDSLEPLHGLSPGTFGGTFENFQELIHPEDRDMVNRAIRTAVEKRSGYDIEFRNVRPNGAVHWIAGKGKVFTGDDGLPERMIGIGMDVTQRKRAEQTARFLADASAALAVLVDFDSTLQKVASLAVPHFADWATVDLLENGDTLRRVAVAHIDPAKVEVAHEIHRRFPSDPSARQGVWNVVRTGQAEFISEISDELLVQSIKDDEPLRIVRELGLRSYVAVPLNVRGKTLGVITFIAAESGYRYDEADLATARDLADRAAVAIENAQLYRELREADRRKDEFLATLAHELRNPLAPIRNGLQVLRLYGAGGEVADETRSIMERQLDQLVRLVDDLLDVSRITRNKLELRKERVTLTAVIDSAVETSRPLIEQAGHTFSLALPSAPVYLDADLTRLAQVFSNLINNSAKYTEPGGRISLTGEVVDDEVVVRVRDNGLGIPAEAMPRLFEMFSQVDRNIERSQGGLGIGLTLVRRLTEMHGGTVEVHSEGPGRGSQFTITLPILKEIAERAHEPSTDQGAFAGPKRRILVVDDNHDSAMSLNMVLKLMGNETQTAHDGLEAVKVAEEFRPDIILLDIGLPKLNGYDACRRIREQEWSKGMMMVALTGWGQEEDRRRSQEAGFDEHLVKPVALAALERILKVDPP